MSTNLNYKQHSEIIHCPFLFLDLKGKGKIHFYEVAHFCKKIYIYFISEKNLVNFKMDDSIYNKTDLACLQQHYSS